MTSPPSHRFEHPREILARHGLRPSRKHSQNFLTAKWAVEAIAHAAIDACQSQPPQLLELGPGAGTLTAALLNLGAQVYAIDKDENMVALLRAEFRQDVESGQLRVEHGDAASHNVSFANIVGNLPYAITGKILRNIIEHRETITTTTIMIQREVAQRLKASPSTKDYGVLTVMVQNNYETHKVCDVGANNFYPPPKVDSAVIQLRKRNAPIVPHDEQFERVVRAAFGQRRKTLRRALRTCFDLDSACVERCENAGIDLGRRAETLDIEEFGRLCRALEARG